MTENRDEKIEAARRLRDEGLSYRKIGKELGVAGTTVARWLDPDQAARQRERKRERYASDPDFAARHREATRNWQAENPGQVILNNSQRNAKEGNYHPINLTADAYREFRGKHDACQNCGSTKKLCVDHCHETGRARLVLCHNCNLALGKLGDTSAALRRLADLLEETLPRETGESK